MFNQLTPKQQYVILGIILLIIAGVGVAYYQKKAALDQEIDIVEEEMPARANLLIVHVAGAVNRPGVYKVKNGTRIIEVIELAGGFNAGADTDSLNLASKLSDGQKLLIPKKVSSLDVPSPATGKKGTSNSSPLINLNSANVEELIKLPGVGKSTAQKIVDFRKTNGPFSQVEDIKKVPRIGEKKFQKLKDFIVVR